MKFFITFAVLIAYTLAEGDDAETPKPIDCPDKLCHGKVDGNYEIPDNYHYFVQCVGGIAYCQACWPSKLVFSERCNQCLYGKDDECATTQAFQAAPATRICPDMCPKKGPLYKGNVMDPKDRHHYVACWEGITIGCVNCPSNLMFNETMNACLYEGKYFTEPIYGN